MKEFNVLQVPVYVEGIMEYTVTASLPTYVSFANRREPNTTDCAFLSPKLFSFKGFPRVGGSQSQSSFSATAEGAHLFGFVSHGGTKQVQLCRVISVINCARHTKQTNKQTKATTSFEKNSLVSAPASLCEKWCEDLTGL